MQRFTERAPLARSASAITVTLDDATYDAGYHYVGVTVDDSLVGNVTAAEKTYGWWAASENTPHTVNIKLTTLQLQGRQDHRGGLQVR